MWNHLPYTVFDTGTLNGFKCAVNLHSCFPELFFLQFSVAQVTVGLRKQFINNFVFYTWDCAAGFNNNNNHNAVGVNCKTGSTSENQAACVKYMG